MICVKRRKSQRKFKHQPTNVDGLSLLLSEGTEQRRQQEELAQNANHDDGENALSLSRSGKSKDVLLGAEQLENDDELERTSLRLGNVTYEMDEAGNWTTDVHDFNPNSEIMKLRALNKKIAQENNLIRVKNELLADMIAKKSLHKEKIEAELDRLKTVLSRPPSRFALSSDKKE